MTTQPAARDERELLRQIYAVVQAKKEARKCKTLDEAVYHEMVTPKRILSCNEPDEFADAILAAGFRRAAPEGVEANPLPSETSWPMWDGKLTRVQAVGIIDKFTNNDDPSWENAVSDFYNEEKDTMPSIMDVFAALGVTEKEYRAASGVDGPMEWPAPTPSPSAEELRRVRAEIGRLVDTRVSALAPKDAYSSKSVGEAVDGIMSLLTTFADARVAEAVKREREVAAQIADAEAQLWTNASLKATGTTYADVCFDMANEAKTIAAAIRERKS